ncbi:hypothetical protein GQR58_014185 [Nymphon striatum]|nr:hypothetical protein GQR58_014185 [Nymphon striatum]
MSKLVQQWVQENPSGPIESSGTKWVQAYHNGPIVSRWSKLVQQWVQVGPVDSLGATAEPPGQTRHDWTTWIRLDPGDFSPGGPDVQPLLNHLDKLDTIGPPGYAWIQVISVQVVQMSKLVQQWVQENPSGPIESSGTKWVQAYHNGPIVSRWSKLVQQWVQVGPVDSLRATAEPPGQTRHDWTTWIRLDPGDFSPGGPDVQVGPVDSLGATAEPPGQTRHDWTTWIRWDPGDFSPGGPDVQVSSAVAPRESKWSNRVSLVQVGSAVGPVDSLGPTAELTWTSGPPGLKSPGSKRIQLVQQWVQAYPGGPIVSSWSRWSKLVQQWVQAYPGGTIVSSWSRWFKLVQQWVQENPLDPPGRLDPMLNQLGPPGHQPK